MCKTAMGFAMRIRPRASIGTAELVVETLRTVRAGLRFAYQLPSRTHAPPATAPIDTANPLEEYFDAVANGPGVWKWRHYFSIYHRHLSKFVGQEVHVVEIGVYSGGSLPMWRAYFGEGCRVYGVDIVPECRVHEREGVRVFIGDQADPTFWEQFRQEVPRIDVVIDDGGHEAHQQIASLKCLLLYLAMGGVYVCEDINGGFQQFHSFIDGVTRPISDVIGERRSPAIAVHQHIASVHRYPALTVIEKPDHAVEGFESPKHGSVWQPGIYDELQ